MASTPSAQHRTGPSTGAGGGALYTIDPQTAAAAEVLIYPEGFISSGDVAVLGGVLYATVSPSLMPNLNDTLIAVDLGLEQRHGRRAGRLLVRVGPRARWRCALRLHLQRACDHDRHRDRRGDAGDLGVALVLRSVVVVGAHATTGGEIAQQEELTRAPPACRPSQGA